MTELCCWPGAWSWLQQLGLRYWFERNIPTICQALLVDLDERLGLLESARDLMVRFDGPEEIRAVVNTLTPVMIEIGPDVPAVHEALLIYLDEQIELLEDVMIFADQSDSLLEIRVAIGFVLGEEESVMVLEDAA